MDCLFCSFCGEPINRGEDYEIILDDILCEECAKEIYREEENPDNDNW